MADPESVRQTEELRNELTAHRAVLAKSCGPDDPIVRLPDAALTDRQLRTLRAAEAACKALPREERRLFHSGWDMDGPRPSRDDLLRGYAGKPVRRFLQLDGWGPNQVDGLILADENGLGCTAGMTFELRSTGSPVRVLVHEGSAQADVLALLATIRDCLARSWDGLVTRPEPCDSVPVSTPAAPPCPSCGRAQEDDLPF